jgi:CheY-like chemotaxis protein
MLAHEASVLIVEDDPATRRLIEASFALSGFSTIEAHNGNQAFEKATMMHPSLAVIDLWLPGMDGFALTQKLKADPRTSDIPLLAVTGHDGADMGTRVRAAGCDALLIKPVTPETLTTTGRLLIERALLLREQSRRARDRTAVLIQQSTQLRAAVREPARTIRLQCRFCGGTDVELVHETEHTATLECRRCQKRWRRGR